MAGTLVIVPCGSAKIWDRDPSRGPVAACDAYVGFPFRVNRQYAERFGDRWVILSAKYGFLPPDAIIPGNYDVSFTHRSFATITPDELREQLRELRLDAHVEVLALGGRAYQQVVSAAFDGLAPVVRYPFAGLPIGKSIQATRRAIAADIAFSA